MNKKSGMTFTVRVFPGVTRGQRRGDVHCSETGRISAVTSRRELIEFMGEEIDLLTPKDDTQWTSLISDASREERRAREQITEMEKAS